MKVLFTGSREWTDRGPVWSLLNSLNRDTIIIEGANPKGLDNMAYEMAGELGFKHRVRFPAQWKNYGNAAGSRRNQLMLDTSKPDLVVAFPTASSKGTLDMMVRAARAGVPVFVLA